MALNGLGWALNMLQADASIELFEEARVRAATSGTRAELATALGNLSRRKALDGDETEAKLLLAETLEIVEALRSPTGVAYYVEMTADTASRAGDHSTAVRLFSASAAIRAATEADAPPPVAKMREEALAAAGATLKDEAVDDARASGASLDVYEAVGEAIAWLGGSRAEAETSVEAVAAASTCCA